jgi:hypothetical protein
MVSVRQDSVVYMTQLIDVRTGRFSRWYEVAAPTSDPRRGYDPSKAQVAAWLDSATMMAARRRTGGPNSGGLINREGRNGPPMPPSTPPESCEQL